jgi:hypothetical protein
VIVVVFRDDRVERWTPVGRRMVVERWATAAEYPAGKPGLGVAERAPGATDTIPEKTGWCPGGALPARS